MRQLGMCKVIDRDIRDLQVKLVDLESLEDSLEGGYLKDWIAADKKDQLRLGFRKDL